MLMKHLDQEHTEYHLILDSMIKSDTSGEKHISNDFKVDFKLIMKDMINSSFPDKYFQFKLLVENSWRNGMKRNNDHFYTPINIHQPSSKTTTILINLSTQI